MELFMKLLSPLALFTVCGLLAAPLMAANQAPELTGCEAKKHAISQELEQARAMATETRWPDWKKP